MTTGFGHSPRDTLSSFVDSYNSFVLSHTLFADILIGRVPSINGRGEIEISSKVTALE